VHQKSGSRHTEVSNNLHEDTSVVDREIVNNLKRKKPGRPRAIPEDQIEEVIVMHESGMGYRAIARELTKRGLSVDWSTVRRIIKKWLSENGHQDGLYSNSNTILPRGLLGEGGIPHRQSVHIVRRWKLI
jgi:hypothetical protein